MSQNNVICKECGGKNEDMYLSLPSSPSVTDDFYFSSFVALVVQTFGPGYWER
jgi:hypothetical protein